MDSEVINVQSAFKIRFKVEAVDQRSHRLSNNIGHFSPTFDNPPELDGITLLLKTLNT